MPAGCHDGRGSRCRLGIWHRRHPAAQQNAVAQRVERRRGGREARCHGATPGLSQPAGHIREGRKGTAWEDRSCGSGNQRSVHAESGRIESRSFCRGSQNEGLRRAGCPIYHRKLHGPSNKHTPRCGHHAAAEKIPTLAAFQDSDGKASSRYLHFALQAPTLDESVTNSDDYIIDRTKGKGHVLILGNSDSPTVIALTAKTASYLKAHCPACTISTKSTTTAQASQIPGIVSSFVLANPDTNYILAVNLDVDEPGILSGLQSAHRTNIPFGGGGSASGPLVKSGTAAFASLNSASYLAWEWTDATLRVIAGQPAVKYPVVERLFDPANVAHINFSASRAATFDWFGKSNYESAFKLAWGLS
jgi:hypothetical protein